MHRRVYVTRDAGHGGSDTFSALANDKSPPEIDAHQFLYMTKKNDPKDAASISLDDLMAPDGLSARMEVFSPGIKVGNETVCRTFQPSFTVTAAGTLLCFCQGRLRDGGDDDLKVVLLNRSFDFGRTWEGARAISAPMNHFAISPVTTGDPGSETITALTCVDLHLTRRAYGGDPQLMKEETGLDLERIGEDSAGVLCHFVSQDQGLTWRMETLTGDRTPLGRTYEGGTLVFLNALGQIQQVESGEHRGRLFTAAPVYGVPKGEAVTNHFRNHPCSGSGVLFSDDLGASWKMHDFIADYLANECSAVTIMDGRALLMVRRLKGEKLLGGRLALTDFRPGFGHRIFQTSADWGQTWSPYVAQPVSGVPCHGTMHRAGRRILFSIPLGYGPDAEDGWEYGREQGVIYFSDDDGDSWSHRVIEPETFSYSSVGHLTGRYHICFYGQGNMGEKGARYRIFTDDWLDAPELS